MKYDPKIHHRRSIRLRNFDYSQEGMYHVVVRTKNGLCILGDVGKGVMKLSEEGVIVERCWKEIPDHFPNAVLDIFQVMPNHLHGILVLKESLVRTRHAVSIRDEAVKNGRAKSEFAKPVSGSLPTIVGSFKSAVTKSAHLAGYKNFGWHGRFYDHVIRDGKDLDRIRRYILDNPANWENDDDFPGNIKMDNIHNEGENRWL